MSIKSISLCAIVCTAIQLCAAFSGDIYVHDPSFIKSGSCYYVFCTGDEAYMKGNAQIRKSCNDNFARIGAEFNSTPTWIKGVIGSTPSNIWAPDINYFNNQYYLYYAGSSFGSQNSAIGVATASNVEGPYSDRGEVMHSSPSNNYNAIDPEIAWTITNGQRAEMWLVFGSWWDGIKMHRLDESTGKLSTSDTKIYSLASRSGGIEASSVAWRDGHYYLFVSFDNCCKGVNSTYRIMVGRASAITGPYVDKGGVDMMKGGGTQLLATHGAVHGPGGQDVYLDGDVYRMIYHWYDANNDGRPTMDIVDLSWSSDGWPSVGSQSKLKYS